MTFAVIGAILGGLLASQPIISEIAPLVAQGIIANQNSVSPYLDAALDTYVQAASSKNKRVALAAHINIIKLSPPHKVAIWLPPLWAARTPYEIENAAAHVRASME